MTEQAGKAREDITAARQLIAELSAKAGGGPAPTPPPIREEEVATEDQADLEEQKLRGRLQDALKACASSLGVEPSPAQQQNQDITTVPSDGEDGPTAKRQRSLEPGSGVRS